MCTEELLKKRIEEYSTKDVLDWLVGDHVAVDQIIWKNHWNIPARISAKFILKAEMFNEIGRVGY